jgi:hypothetical protein
MHLTSTLSRHSASLSSGSSTAQCDSRLVAVKALDKHHLIRPHPVFEIPPVLRIRLDRPRLHASSAAGINDRRRHQILVVNRSCVCHSKGIFADRLDGTPNLRQPDMSVSVNVHFCRVIQRMAEEEKRKPHIDNLPPPLLHFLGFPFGQHLAQPYQRPLIRLVHVCVAKRAPRRAVVLAQLVPISRPATDLVVKGDDSRGSGTAGCNT